MPFDFDIDSVSLSLDEIDRVNGELAPSRDVAVVGAACRTPFGDSPEDFWQCVVSGENGVTGFHGRRRQDMDDFIQATWSGEKPGYVSGAFIRDVDMFDYRFFHMTPKEAVLTDPAHRMFWESAVSALENAGYGGVRVSAERVGVYIGFAGNVKDSYLNYLWKACPGDLPQALAANMNGMMGGRLSYLLDLRGVAQVTDATCASSLLAVHNACRDLQSGECSMAIAAGVRVNLLPVDSEIALVGVESTDYQTRTFDDAAGGFGVGEGVVVLLLKPLENAERDGDHIIAVIKGSAAGQGGASLGPTVPNPDAIRDVLKSAWDRAGVAVDSIGLLEAHGTATRLGDPIEVSAARQAFESRTSRKSFCAIGSVKSNIGHLYEASGIAGLLKAILALRYKILPPTINFTYPNREIPFVEGPFYVNVKARQWERTDGLPRAAAVNSLGLNGTNCHVIVQEYDGAQEPLEPAPPSRLLTKRERCWASVQNHDAFSADQTTSYGLRWEKRPIASVTLDARPVLIISESVTAIDAYKCAFGSKGVPCAAVLANISELDGALTELNGKYKRALYIPSPQTQAFDGLLGMATVCLLIYEKLSPESFGLVTRPGVLITGQELEIDPSSAALSAMLIALAREDDSVSVSVIDTDAPLDADEPALEFLFPDARRAALRGGLRFEPVFAPLSVSSGEPARWGSCRLVTGGTSRVVLSVCAKIAQISPGGTFILLARGAAAVCLASGDPSIPKYAAALEGIRTLNALGSRVVIERADDISDERQMVPLAKRLKAQYSIDCVIHGAGVGDTFPLKGASPERIRAVIAPKAKGLLLLESLFGASEPMYLLFSSIAAVFTAPTQGAYAAANAFLDAFADALRLKGRRVMAVQWSTWKEIGMAAAKGVAQDYIFESMPTTSALDYFAAAASRGIAHSLLGKLNTERLGVELLSRSGISLSPELEELVRRKREQPGSRRQEPMVKAPSTVRGSIQSKVDEICRRVLGFVAIDPHENFLELGADSLQMMNLHRVLDETFPGRLKLTDIFSYSNIFKLSAFLSGGALEPSVVSSAAPTDESDGIAIVGVYVNLAHAKTPDEFFDNLLNGQCLVSQPPKWRREAVLDYLAMKGKPTDAVEFSDGAYLSDVGMFDYGFFRLSPREAALIDPHQRLLLKAAVGAIEDAGYGGDALYGSNTGVFLGFATNLRDMYARVIHDVEPSSVPDSVVGNTNAVIAGRVSHYLNLKGVSAIIDTACSSSMAALDMAVKYLKASAIDCALVGGIRLILMPTDTESGSLKIGMESADGLTRSFDRRSDGTAFSEGVEMVMLKPLSAAVRDRDHIYGVICATASNQDGNSAGVTAPNPQSQLDVILKAWSESGINPEELGYIETHGTGTQLGDVIEMKSLTEAFSRFTGKAAFCPAGSLKPNYGHLSEGSGLLGLIKGLMALEREMIPANIHFQDPNPKIDFASSAVFLNARNTPWKRGPRPRLFAISNFGMSGTNVHAVVSDFDPPIRPRTGTPALIALSNATPRGLRQAAWELASFLSREPNTNLADLSFTLARGRGRFEHRLAIVSESISTLAKALNTFAETGATDGESSFYSREIGTPLSEGNGFIAAARLFASGGEPDWAGLLDEEQCCRVSVPGYAYNETNCWVKAPKRVRPDCLYYSTIWQQSEAISQTSLFGNVLLIYDGSDAFSEGLRNALETSCAVVAISREDVLSGWDSAEACAELLKDCDPDHIIHAASLGCEGDPVLSERLGVSALLRLIKGLALTGRTRKLGLTVITRQVWEVTGREDLLSPFAASLIGLARVAALESPFLTSQAIDIDTAARPGAIISEIAFKKPLYKIAYRGGARFTERFTQLDIGDYAPLSVRSDGRYVITGGTGGIGLALAGLLASRNPRVRLSLITLSRRYLTDVAVTAKIDKLKAVGASVSICLADVSDGASLASAFAQIRGDSDQIVGVIHCAGIAGAGVLANKTEADFFRVVAPKYQGTLNLFRETLQDKLDFFAVCSSGVTLTGEAAQGDYVAANTFLDAFADYANRKGIRARCYNWGSWKSEGMSVRFGINVDDVFMALETGDALRAFESVLSSSVTRSFVGKLNAPFFRDQGLDLSEFPFEIDPKLASKMLDGRESGAKLEFAPRASQKRQAVTLEGRGQSDCTAVERGIAEAFSGVLGLEAVPVDVSFFELGGDSILLSRLHAELDSRNPGKIKLLDLFTYTTVDQIASFIADGADGTSARQSAESSFDNMIRLFESGQISADELASFAAEGEKEAST